jgi:hypothetical protein
MLIYADSDVCQYHLEQINQSFTRDFEKFVEYTGPKSAVFHVPFPWKGGYGDLFLGRLTRVVNDCEQVAIFSSELHNRIFQFIQDFDRPNVTFYTCGYINRKPNHAQLGQWMDWFITTLKFYKNVPTFLDKLTPYAVKPKSFDALLGQPRSHRDIAYSYLKEHQDQVVLTYMRDFSQGLYDHDFNAQTIQSRPNTEYTWDIDGIGVPNKPVNFTIEHVQLHGQQVSISQVVPINIYNETAYSVITETNFMNSYTFYTEKTVKPILARRLFVAFGGQHYIRNLHNLGFQTFDGIIDESYDEEPDQQRRYAMVYEQMQYLFSQPQEEILEKIKPIVEYNYQHMLTTDWYGDFSRNFLQGFKSIK